MDFAQTLLLGIFLVCGHHKPEIQNSTTIYNRAVCKRILKLLKAEFQDIDYDDSSSVLSDASESEEVAQNISMWEEGIDEEPIVGNELVNIRQIDLQNNHLQQEEHEDDEEEDIEEKIIVPSFE